MTDSAVLGLILGWSSRGPMDFNEQLSHPTGTGVVGPVLIVEDHVDTRQMVELFLDLNGIATATAENGLAGLAALHEHRPSVILLDLSMPVMDGWSFRAAQQKLSDPELAGVPVVVLSALNYCEREAAQLGAVAVIPKPIDFDRLLQVVRSYCMRQSDAAYVA